MKLLVINPGSSVSTIDCHNGMVAALKRAGHAVYEYALDRRIDRSAKWLYWMWDQGRAELRRDARLLRKKRALSGHPLTASEYRDVVEAMLATYTAPRPTGMDTAYWAGSFAIEMALRIEPEIVLVVSGMYLLKQTMALLRKAVKPWAQMVLMATEAPYDDYQHMQIAPLFDIVFVNERTSLPAMRIANPETFYLPHAYDPDVHRPDAPMDDDVPSHDVCFVGSGFAERIELLEAVDWTGIDLGLYGPWPDLSRRSKLRPYLKAEYVPNAHASMLYRKARINLNLYRESMGFGPDAPRVTSAESLNPRAYELAALGAFQISSNRAEVRETFGYSVPLAHPASLGHAIREYLDRPGIRAEYAALASTAVQGHTYDARARQLTEVLERVRVAA